MNTNDILKRLRYTFDFSDAQMIDLFALGDYSVTRAQVSDWLKKEEDPEYKEMSDKELATFLNGFIQHKRGKKEGEPMIPEIWLNNNIVLKKIKIALNLKTDDILALLDSLEFYIGASELSALFRNPSHPKYRECQDQFLRKFLIALQQKYRTT